MRKITNAVAIIVIGYIYLEIYERSDLKMLTIDKEEIQRKLEAETGE